MKAAVVIFPGSTCEQDAYFALKDGLGIDTHYVFHTQTDLNKYFLVVLPGGFTYGDYLRVGALAAKSPIIDALRTYVENEQGYVVGICNGFQILTEANILPGTLTRNLSNSFICKPVELTIENADTPFTRLFKEGEKVYLPIAHSDGRYVAPQEVLLRLIKRKQIFLKYHNWNPNGSVMNIAGISNSKFNVFGLMPHPERFSHRFIGSDIGLKFFKSILEEVRP